jgi:hypothetical protein
VLIAKLTVKILPYRWVCELMQLLFI